jgi:hypothetical protein
MAWFPFYRKPLPVFNAPAANNALFAAMSGPLYSLGGIPVQDQLMSTEGALVKSQDVRVIPYNGQGVPSGQMVIQTLIDPKAKR